MRKGVNFDFTLDGATASLGSVLVYDAPLIDSLFELKAYAASLSKDSVAVDDPQGTTPSAKPSSIPENSELYSIIRPMVDDQDILLWHPSLGHLSLPAIKRLPNAVRGIELHAKSPSICTCDECIPGKMFPKLFQRSEDKATTRLLELIHSNVIRPMLTQAMRGY